MESSAGVTLLLGIVQWVANSFEERSRSDMLTEESREKSEMHRPFMWIAFAHRGGRHRPNRRLVFLQRFHERLIINSRLYLSLRGYHEASDLVVLLSGQRILNA
jgi:hypothetical protein